MSLRVCVRSNYFPSGLTRRLNRSVYANNGEIVNGFVAVVGLGWSGVEKYIHT